MSPENAGTFISAAVSLLMEAASCSRPPATRLALSADSRVCCLQAVMQWSLARALKSVPFSVVPSHTHHLLIQEPITLIMARSGSFSAQGSAAV